MAEKKLQSIQIALVDQNPLVSREKNSSNRLFKEAIYFYFIKTERACSAADQNVRTKVKSTELQSVASQRASTVWD